MATPADVKKCLSDSRQKTNDSGSVSIRAAANPCVQATALRYAPRLNATVSRIGTNDN